MIQLTRQGLAGCVDEEHLERQFERAHVFRFPGLLHPDLIRYVTSQLDSCAWTTDDHGSIAREMVPEKPIVAALLNFAANTDAFLSLMRRITHCPRITWFSGRVYRMVPMSGHFDSWHADIGTTHQDRLVGMSINLSARPYEGGVFRLREESGGAILCELPNAVPGDAIFFRISPALKHMVTPVEGVEPKTAFAGWFQSGEVEGFQGMPGPQRTL